MSTPFEQLVHVIYRARPVSAQPRADGRLIERLLISYLKSHRVEILDVAGEPILRVVRHYEAEEAIVTKISIERLAKFLVGEIAR
jgi:hypothetical protein